MKEIVIGLIAIGFMAGALCMIIIFLIGLKLEEIIKNKKEV